MKLLTILLLVVATATAATERVPEGKTATLDVEHDGTAPFTYQWAKNGVDIPGATTKTHVLAAVTADAAGIYTVRISNEAGSISSDEGIIVIVTKPTRGVVKIIKDLVALIRR